MFSPRTRVTILIAIAIAIAWLPVSAAGQIKIGYTSEAAIELAGSKGVTIAIEGAGFDQIRGVVVSRDSSGRDRITEITGSYRGGAQTGYLTLALGGVATPGTYYVFVTDGRQLAPVPVELTVASANEPPVVSGVFAGATVEQNQQFTVRVDAQDDRGLGGIEWEFAGTAGRQDLPPAKVGFEPTSATLTFELTTALVGDQVISVTAFDLDELRSDVAEYVVTVHAPAPPAKAPAVLDSPPGGSVLSGESMNFEWSPVDGAVGYQWVLAEDPDLVGGTVQTQTGLSVTTQRTPLDPTTYYFAVQAVNAAGMGPRSEPAQVTVAGQPLGQPTVINSYPADPGQPDVEPGESFRFQWSSVANATAYEYCLSSNPETCSPAGLGATGETSDVTANFSRGTSGLYFFLVVAKRNSTVGPLSEAGRIFVGMPPPPPFLVSWETMIQGFAGAGVPQLLPATNETDATSFTMRFWWETVSGDGQYEACYGYGSTQLSCSTPGPNLMANHHTVQESYDSPHCDYFFKVRVVRPDGRTGSFSDLIHGTRTGPGC